jgi:hypothetical protein
VKDDDALTLADLALRETYRTRHPRVLPEYRTMLASARRFVLDADMSAFFAHLSTANFYKQKLSIFLRSFNTTRLLARLPHSLTWIEYEVEPYEGVLKNHYGITRRDPIDPNKDYPTKIGWLIRQHPTLETAFRLTMILAVAGRARMVPFDLAWTVTDDPVPWPCVASMSAQQAATCALGLVTEYDAETEVTTFFAPDSYLCVSVLPNEITDRYAGKDINNDAVNHCSELRKVITLLAAINDIPVGIKKVVPSHGFFAKGRYRSFLDHHVITLTLPKGRDPQKAARQIIAISRRRAHQVRGHWRRDWRHEGCRIWIKEHQRGDASLGFVTHDYRVEHETTPHESY